MISQSLALYAATVDAVFKFTEWIQNIHFVRRDRAAGFSGVPNPSNDKLHSAVQQLNAARNIVQLIKDKLKNGVVRPDQSLLEKLKLPPKLEAILVKE